MLTFLVWKCHLFYPNKIANIDSTFDQHLFFAALLVNWVCLVLTAFVAGLIAEQLLGARDVQLFTIAALVCLLSFYTQVAVITDLAEGPAWVLMALAFLAYLRGARCWLLLMLVLAMFQREMILLAMGFLAAMELIPWRGRRRMAVFTFAAAISCFAVYIVFRRALGGGWEFQSHPFSFLLALTRITFSKDLLFQGLLSQNILFIALGACLAAEWKPPAVRYWMPKLLATFAFLAVVSLGSYEGNTTGRLAAILVPGFAACAALSLRSQDLSGMEREAPRTSLRGTNQVAYVFLVLVATIFFSSWVFQKVHPRQRKSHPAGLHLRPLVVTP